MLLKSTGLVRRFRGRYPGIYSAFRSAEQRKTSTSLVVSGLERRFSGHMSRVSSRTATPEQIIDVQLERPAGLEMGSGVQLCGPQPLQSGGAV